MSDPARLLQSLNLDDMPVTRSQSQTPQQRGGRSPRGRGRGRGRAQPPPPQVGPIRAHSGIHYDTQILSPTSSRRAAEGLQSEFWVDRLSSYGLGGDRYYAFQISKPVAVRIHDPSGGTGRVYECTCEDFRNTQRPCAHVWVSLSQKPKLFLGHAYIYSGCLPAFMQCLKRNKKLPLGDLLR